MQSGNGICKQDKYSAMKRLMEMIGYQLDNSRGLSWWLRRIHPEDRNRLADKIKEATDNLQQSWQDEYRFKCADGSYKACRR